MLHKKFYWALIISFFSLIPEYGIGATGDTDLDEMFSNLGLIKKPFESLSITRELLEKSIPESVSADLRFFWTSGIKEEDCTQLGKKDPILIGGEKYATGFERLLTQLVTESPASLTVHLVTDERTLHTNPWLETLQERHPQKLELSFSAPISQTLQEKFPEFRETVRVLFQNGEQGNPAIASDAYRLLMGVLK